MKMRYTTYLCLVVCAFSITDSKCQDITMDPFDIGNAQTSCQSGVLEGEKYVLTGTANASSASNPNYWTVNIVLRASADGLSPYTILCLVDPTCPGNYNKECYCDRKVGDVYYFVLNKTASVLLSNFQIWAIWTGGIFETVTSNKQYMPAVYGLHHVSLKINETVYTDNDTLRMDVVINDYIEIEFCVSSLENATLTIQFDIHNVEQKVNGCIITNTTIKDHHIGTSFNFSYSDGCKRSSMILLYLNDFSSTSNVSHFTTVTTNLDVNVTGVFHPPKYIIREVLALGLGLGLGLFLLLTLITAIIWIRCPIWFCKTHTCLCCPKRQNKTLNPETALPMQSNNIKNEKIKDVASTSERAPDFPLQHNKTRRILPSSGRISPNIFPEMIETNLISDYTRNETPKRKKARRKHREKKIKDKS